MASTAITPKPWFVENACDIRIQVNIFNLFRGVKPTNNRYNQIALTMKYTDDLQKNKPVGKGKLELKKKTCKIHTMRLPPKAECLNISTGLISSSPPKFLLIAHCISGQSGSRLCSSAILYSIFTRLKCEKMLHSNLSSKIFLTVSYRKLS